MADEGKHQKQQAGSDRGDDNCPRNVSFRVFGLFGQGGNGIEPEKREAEHRSTGHQRGERDVFASVTDERCGQVDAVAPGGDEGNSDRDEHSDEDELNQHDDVARSGHRSDTDDVQHRHQQNAGHHEDPGWHDREQDVQVDPDNEVVHQGQQHVVEQESPPREESNARAEALARVGIGGTGNGIHLHHRGVGESGEDHRGESDDVGQRGSATRAGRNHAVGGENGQRNHVDEPEKDKRRKPEHPSKGSSLRAVNVVTRARRRHIGGSG